MTHPRATFRYSALIADEIPVRRNHAGIRRRAPRAGLQHPLSRLAGAAGSAPGQQRRLARGGRQPPARGEYHPRGHAPGRPQALTFKRLIDEGASHEDVTHRFGLATRTVERRVRFAHLAPPILEAFRAGTKGRRGATYGRFD